MDKNTLSLIPPLLLQFIQKYKPKNKKFNYLDIGCGYGDISYILYRNGFLDNATITAIDQQKKALNYFKKQMPHIKKIEMNIENLKTVPSNSFDFIVCNQVIEHMEDDGKFAQELYRILRKNGYLFIASVLKKWYGLYWHTNKYGKIVVDPDHKKEYASKDEFERNLKTAGFRVKKTVIVKSQLPIIDYILLLLKKISFIKFENLKFYYTHHPFILRLANKLCISPIPGYSIIETIVQKI